MSTFPYEEPIEPNSVGINEDELAKVVERFRDQQLTGAFPGGQLVVRRHKKLVLNMALGIARGFRPGELISHMPVSPKTSFPLFSAGKPLAAVVIALLEDRGVLDIHAPIAEIFPDFARHGKGQITTLDVLTHRSGILMPDFSRNMGLWNNRKAIQEALINTVPSYPRGTLAYHPYEYGWVLSEIVLRVDGRSLPKFFSDEFAMPLHLSALQFGVAERDISSLAFPYWLGKKRVMVAGINVAEGFEEQNSAQFFNAQNPAVSLVGNAANLAAFYDFLLEGGKTSAGQQIIAPATLRKYTSRHILAWDRSLKTFMAVGRGFVVGSRFPSSFGWRNTQQVFGHAGAFSSLAFGDYAKDIAVAIVTNGNRSLYDFAKRFWPLAHGIRRACQDN